MIRYSLKFLTHYLNPFNIFSALSKRASHKEYIKTCDSMAWESDYIQEPHHNID